MIKKVIYSIFSLKSVIILSAILSIAAIYYSFTHGLIIAYGDAESHLNIAKRVINSLTPGFSQLGGIWLPLPHLLMIPFVFFDPLWRSGLAGSIISGIAYIATCVYIYKFTYLITKNTYASFVAFLVFSTNLNILYMQTTPMTELPLIAFFTLSSYYFIKFLQQSEKTLYLVIAAFFGFCATLTRYDGWFLVFVEALILVIFYLIQPAKRTIWEGKIILFSTLAFFGILLWLGWDTLILGDPLYFSNSPFSANSQQQGWLLRGELPAYKNIIESTIYYLVTTIKNSGSIIAVTAYIGLGAYLIYNLWNRPDNKWPFILLIMFVPFIFYVITLYLGQSVIFIPDLTPETFEWQLFNVRYGLMMIPIIAFLVGFLFYKIPKILKPIIILLIFGQIYIFAGGQEKVITLADGTEGLSAYKKPDAQQWMIQNYDTGLVLMDDYARTMSVIRTNIPMQNTIYIGNKPYWEESLKEPEKYATWIIMQKDDAIWKSILENPNTEGRLYKYFSKVYTSPDILIFKRTTSP